jgi:hypothetical protein
MIEAITFWLAKAVADFLIVLITIGLFLLFVGVVLLADKWSDK